MARTTEGARLTQEHRRLQLAIRAATIRDLLALWAAVQVTNLAGTIVPWATAAAVLVRSRHRDSAALAARYYRAFRAAEQVPGTVTPQLAEPLDLEVAADHLRGAALAGILKARRSGSSIAAAAQRGFVKASGEATTLTLNGARRTIIGTGQADPRADRWMRVTSGQPCAFCATLASRGGVFRTSASADFQAHEHCSCVPEIAYEGSEATEQARRFRELYDRAQREVSVSGTSNDRLNAFRRLYEGRT